MIKIGKIRANSFRYETLEEALARYMANNKISMEDVINLAPDRDNPSTELHIYYKEKDF